MRTTVWHVAAIGAVMFLIGCGGGGSGDVGDTGSPELQPADGDMLVVGLEVDLDTMFPPTSNSVSASDVYGHIYWYLMRSNPDFITVRPGLADSFRFSADSLSIDYFIHPGITWHDGEPFTADDVVFAHDVCKAPEIGWSAVDWLEHITNVEALDPLTVRFTFDEPYMYQVQDSNVCYPLPKHILGDVPFAEMSEHPTAREPVGNGPFRFVSWESGQEVVIQTSLTTQIQNGDIDLWTRFGPAFYPQLSEAPGLTVHSYPGRSYSYVAWNRLDPLFEDKRVRQAMTMAIDRQQIVDALVYGQATVGTQPLISTIWAHDPTIEPYPFDPERAKALLEEAGWTDSDGDGVREKDGREFKFQMATNGNNRMRVDIVTVIQQQLKDVGAEVTPNVLEFNTFIDQLLAKDYQSAVGGWSVGIKAALTSMFGKDALFNFVSADNERMLELMAQAELERDMDKAKRLWSEMQRISVDESYYTYLFQLNDLHVINERFENTDMNAYGWSFNLEEWFVPEGRQRYNVPVGASPMAEAGQGSDAASSTGR
jgi:peptide/nickel transport system substrate-binding protein